jgi:hypothetical protein
MHRPVAPHHPHPAIAVQPPQVFPLAPAQGFAGPESGDPASTGEHAQGEYPEPSALQVCAPFVPPGQGQLTERPGSHTRPGPVSMVLIPASTGEHAQGEYPEPSALQVCAPLVPLAQGQVTARPGSHTRPGPVSMVLTPASTDEHAQGS